MRSHFLSFLNDESANGTTDYALVAASFGLAMLATMVLVDSAAIGQLGKTYTGLDNRNGITP